MTMPLMPRGFVHACHMRYTSTCASVQQCAVICVRARTRTTVISYCQCSMQCSPFMVRCSFATLHSCSSHVLHHSVRLHQRLHVLSFLS